MNYSDLEKENQALRSEVSSLKQIMSVSNRTIYIEKYNELVNKYNNLLLNYKSVKESLSRYNLEPLMQDTFLNVAWGSYIKQ